MRDPKEMNHLFVIVFVFLVSLNGGLSNTIQISLSTLCDSSASLLLILLQNTNLLECLHDLSVDASTGIDVVRWAGATVAGGAVNFS